jgi:sulfatase maturation enzyme AslB (radical SAM superfamily)
LTNNFAFESDLQHKLKTVLFLGNNDESTDHQVSEYAAQNNSINHGLVTDPHFKPTLPGYYHTTVVDIPFGHLINVAQEFDAIVMLDQPQAEWSHWKCLSATAKLMMQLEELKKHTVFRDNKNLKKILYWTDLLYNKNKSFCIYPWVNLHNTGKKTTLCSRDGTKVTTIEKLQDWATDPDYTEIRQKMLKGTLIPDHCGVCYEYEKRGIESYRQFETLDWISQLDLESIDDLTNIDRPYYHEMLLGNHCNIKCRGCQPAFSKPIGDEIKKFNIITPHEVNWEPYGSKLDQINIDTLDKKSTVYFQGGEPTIMPEVLEFMTQCIEKNKTDFNLNFTTNGVTLPTKFLKLISNFSKTNFSFSIDGFGPINDYWRSGSNWDKVIANAKLLQSQGHSININTVPGLYNVTNLHLLFEFLDREFPMTAVYLQINYLKWQSAFNHPNKELVIDSMKKCMNTSTYRSNGKSCKTSIDSIYNHYSNDPVCNLDDLRDFFKYNDQLDRARGVRLVDYIPDLEAARSLI